jgi:hypothetical protein
MLLLWLLSKMSSKTTTSNRKTAMPDTTTPPTADQPLDPHDVAWLMNAIWESLQSPGWTFGTRKDLEKLGEAIYSGKKLRDIDDKVLTRLLPHLKVVTTHLGNLLLKYQPTKLTPPTAEVSAVSPEPPVTT